MLSCLRFWKNRVVSSPLIKRIIDLVRSVTVIITPRILFVYRENFWIPVFNYFSIFYRSLRAWRARNLGDLIYVNPEGCEYV